MCFVFMTYIRVFNFFCFLSCFLLLMWIFLCVAMLYSFLISKLVNIDSTPTGLGQPCYYDILSAFLWASHDYMSGTFALSTLLSFTRVFLIPIINFLLFVLLFVLLLFLLFFIAARYQYHYVLRLERETDLMQFNNLNKQCNALMIVMNSLQFCGKHDFIMFQDTTEENNYPTTAVVTNQTTSNQQI